jgi:hypothetical protein
MNDKLNGRRVVAHLQDEVGQYSERQEIVTANAVKVVAALGACDIPLFVVNGCLVLVRDGRLIQVSGDVLQQIIGEHLVTQHLVDRGPPGAPYVEIEYRPLVVSPDVIRRLLTAQSAREGGLAYSVTRVELPARAA